MDILDAILNAQGGGAVEQLGSQLGLGKEEATSALSALVPALASGFQRNLQGQDGLASLLSALSAGSHQRYIDDPASLNDQAAVAEGNGILGHVFGSKDVSREVASRAAAQTGLSGDVMKKMLPLAANLMMGAFAQKTSGTSSMMAGLTGSGGGIAGMLTPLFDRDKDGSILDDVAGMIGRFLGRP